MEKPTALALKKCPNFDSVTGWHTVKALSLKTFNTFHIVFFYYGGTNHLAAINPECRQSFRIPTFIICKIISKKEFKALQPYALLHYNNIKFYWSYTEKVFSFRPYKS